MATTSRGLFRAESDQPPMTVSVRPSPADRSDSAPANHVSGTRQVMGLAATAAK